jgi:hypothetical protein
LSGGGGNLTFPIEAGDTCLIFFNDVNMDTWIASGNAGAPPLDARLHSFSDAIVLVGLRAFPQALANYFTTGVRLHFEGTKIELTNKIKLANDATDLKTLLDGLIDLIAAAQVGGVPLSNAAAISAYKTTVGTLLT